MSFEDAKKTIGDLKKTNKKCAACKYFVYCGGGCRALSYVYCNEHLHEDTSKCLFFGNNYYSKIVDTLAGFKNKTPIINPSNE